MRLAKDADTIICAKGRQVVSFDMKKNPPDRQELLKHMLGPTGNLRAPTIQVGKTLLVGFDEPSYSEVLAAR